MQFDGLIFDIDGTLWDSRESVARGWSAGIFERYGIERAFTPEEITSIMGLTAREIGERLFPKTDIPMEEMVLSCFEAEYDYIGRFGAELYPHAEEVLSALSRRAPLYLVSNCEQGYIRCFFKATGFDRYIADVACVNRPCPTKAENLRYIREKHGLRRPVYIGDTALDEQSCSEAGIPMIHAAYGFGTAKAPLAAIWDLSELLGLIEG